MAVIGGSADESTIAWLGVLFEPEVKAGEAADNALGHVNSCVRQLVRLVTVLPESNVDRLAMADAGGSCPNVPVAMRPEEG